MDFSMALTTILVQYFSDYKCVYYFRDKGEEDLKMTVPFVVTGNLSFDDSCNGFVIISQDARTVFDYIEDSLYAYASYRNTRRYLIVGDGVNDVFESRNLQFVFDLLVVQRSRLQDTCYRNFVCECCYDFHFFTHSYVGSKGNEVVVLDIWSSANQSFSNGRNLYPDKVQDQRGRILRASAFTYIPYSDLDNGLGSEMELVKEYARKRNNTLVIKKDYPWGGIFKNGTSNGILGQVFRDEADFAFTGIFSWFRIHEYFDFTHDFINTKVTCITPSPKIQVTWRYLLPDYKIKLTLCYIGLNVLANLALYCFVRTISFFESTLLVFRTQLLQTIPLKIQSLFMRLIIFHLLLLGTIMSSIFSSRLSSIFTVPNYVGQINTVKDLADSDLKWLGTQIVTWTDFIYYEENPVYHKLLANSEELHRGRINDTTVAYAVEKLLTNFYAFDELISEDVIRAYRPMEDNLYNTHCVQAFRKNSVILPAFNKLLLEAQASGLGLKWETDAIIYSRNLRKQFAITFDGYKVRGQIRLDISRVKGVLILLAIGVTLSFFCFMLEVIVHRITNN